MTARKAYDEASRIDAVDGEVALDGPGGVGLSMTPDAADETSRRLSEAARTARTQPPGQDDDPDPLVPHGADPHS